MKMKRALLTTGAVAALFALPALAHGQSSNVPVSATVNAVITPVKSADLSFGAANPGTTVTIDALAVPTTGNRGEVEVSHNTFFTVAATITQLTDGTNTLTGSYYCAYTAAAGGTTGLHGTTGTSLCTALPKRESRTGPTYIMIGGEVVIPAGATAGTYTGQVQLTFTATAT